MISRIYADNYKSLVNFDFRPAALSLILGRNGSGKSSIFEVIAGLSRVAAEGEAVACAFPLDSRTRWDTRPVQTFEIDMDLGDPAKRYTYALKLEHDQDRQRSRIAYEGLKTADKTLIKGEYGVANLYRDDGSDGPQMQYDWTRSVLFTTPERPDNRLLTTFRERLGRCWMLRPDPFCMRAVSEREAERPDSSASDLVDWLRHFSQEHPAEFGQFVGALRSSGAIDNLKALRLAADGEHRKVLRVSIENRPGDEYRLDELSEGQRIAVLLYSLVHQPPGEGLSLCLDEPENFLALGEIQPWLQELVDRAEEQSGFQALLVSHHPELIDYLASGNGYWVEREEDGPSRVQRIDEEGADGMPLSELIARGWLRG